MSIISNWFTTFSVDRMWTVVYFLKYNEWLNWAFQQFIFIFGTEQRPTKKTNIYKPENCFRHWSKDWERWQNNQSIGQNNAENEKLMLLRLACRRVLGHKVPRLRHLYKPIKSKINQYLNNSQNKFNTNYRKIYMILLKLQQITSNNRLERFIYIPSGGDIIKTSNFN